MAENTIILDCERMRNPNTGLYFFCDKLADGLSKESERHNRPMGFYVPKRFKGRWGFGHGYKIFHNFHKLFIPQDTAYKLWHTTFQLSSYVPTSDKLVLTVHDLNFLYEKRREKHLKYIKKLQQLVDRADYVVTISETTRKDILKYINIRNKPLEVIYNGCNIYSGEIVPPVNKPEHPFLFTIGTILTKKNFHVLPCLLKNNDYELIIAGNRSEYEERIMQEAQRYGVQDRVRIIGNVSEAEKHWYLKNCEAFMFPSIAEGFGLPVLEAMYYKKPVFLSSYTCLPEIGSRFAYYFNSEFNEREMREEFERGMNDFSRGGIDKEEMKEHALQFSWDAAAKRYWEIYEKLLNE